MLMLSFSGCTSGTSDPVEAIEDDKAGDPNLLYLPQRVPRLDAAGPFVPGTPGLRVPKGYFTRVRLDVRDLFLPYAVASFLRGEDETVFRLEAVSEFSDQWGTLPIFRALVPITLSSSSDIKSLTKITLGPAALNRAMATIRLENGRQYLVEVQRLSFEVLEDSAVKGSLEGRARRGMLSKSYKQIKVGFVALRAPDTGMLRAENAKK